MSAQETAVVVGVGPGLGLALVRCFAGEGMRVFAAARTPEKLKQELDDIDKSSSGSVTPVACDTTREQDVKKLYDMSGCADVTVFNAGAFVSAGLLDTSVEEFERCWRVGCLGGFLVGREAATHLCARREDGGKGGSILFTGATASLRGSARFHNLAVGKFGLRALAQSMARELSPQGIHVAHVIVDGQIKAERDGYRESERGEDAVINPNELAKNYLFLHRQARNAWTLELDLRPYVERF